MPQSPDCTDGNADYKERLLPGHKLLFSGPATAVSVAAELQRSFQATHDTSDEIAKEYFGIQAVLSDLVGPQNLILSDFPLVVGRNTSNGVHLESVPLHENLRRTTTPIPFLSDMSARWPRNAYVAIGQSVFAAPGTWEPGWMDQTGSIASLLGDGGKVEVKNNGIIVTPDVYKQARTEIRNLEQAGFRVAVVPFVQREKQRFVFAHDDVDGHIRLIETSSGGLALVAATSYLRQGDGTMKRCRFAASHLGAELVEVDDKYLPPLAFNFLQLADRSIIVTASERRDLELTLKQLVGDTNVHTTPIPLEILPLSTIGSVHCMTNEVPPTLLAYL